jgi:hypothetical protein
VNDSATVAKNWQTLPRGLQVRWTPNPAQASQADSPSHARHR